MKREVEKKVEVDRGAEKGEGRGDEEAGKDTERGSCDSSGGEKEEMEELMREEA